MKIKVTHILYLQEVEGMRPFSGAENHIWILLPALVQMGIEVELIAMLWHGTNYITVKQRLKDLTASGVEVIVILRDSRKGYMHEASSKLLSWVKLWKCLQQRRDHVIHLHLELLYSPFIAWLAGCRRIVITIHNDTPIYKSLYYRFRLRLLNHLTVRFIAITDRVRSFYIQCSHVSPDRVTTIRYGIDLITDAPYLRDDFNVPKDKFVVGFVGRLVPQKNLFTLVDALQKQPDITGIIVGDGPQKYDLMRYAEKSGAKNLRFLGAVEEAWRIMPIFDVLCLPSKWEGLGLVLLEAMLQHIPIIGSNCGAIPEILDQGRYGLVTEPTADGISQAINWAFENPALMRERAERAYDYVHEQFSINRMVECTLNVYRLTAM